MSDPSLTDRQRSILEFSSAWLNNPTQPARHGDGANVVYADNPGLTRLHARAVGRVEARVGLREGFAGPGDNVDTPRL